MNKQNTPDPCLLFQKPSQKKGNHVFIPELHSSDIDQGREPIDIQSEISYLQTHITRLELELQWKERYYCQQLDRLSQTIANAVCIQPSRLSVYR